MLDHPHEPDLDWYYVPGYFVDDVPGGVLDNPAKRPIFIELPVETDYQGRRMLWRS